MELNELIVPGYAPTSVICQTGEFVVLRALAPEHEQILLKVPASQRPSAAVIHQLEHEYEIAHELDPAFVVRPLLIERRVGSVALLLEDFACHALIDELTPPLELGRFFNIAIAVTEALAAVHRLGVVHKDIKPENIFLGGTGLDGGVQAKLTGFGVASKLSRERQAASPPEIIAGTLAYMAPEQTGRMNRSIDSRSDLYALGVAYYQMLAGRLPFAASDAMEWVHCHIALQPPPPSQHRADISGPLSDIIMKLLAKAAEDRYQTAEGLKADLERCAADWREHACIAPFQLGARDIPDRLLIPEKLYGRKHEIEMLLAAFDRVVAGGAPELVLVTGYSGVGKSAVVNELHKALVPPRGLFAAGKFDQYKRDIPYATLAHALQGLVRQVLGKGEEEVACWREALLEAVGPNGQLVANLVPDLVLLIGEQPPVPEAPLQDAQNRFNMVFRRFLGVFARPGSPLALFLDDLQWLDTATLQFLEYLVVHPEVKHLLLLGAYRDNEVSAAHPLVLALDAMRQSGASIHSIVLGPLTQHDLGRLVTDAFYCEEDRAEPLARLVYEKTGGNPFFAIQFLTTLAEEGLVTFDGRAAGWRWDLDRIRSKGFTDNVADLMAGKVNRLPEGARDALKQFACLGNKAKVATLALVQGASEERVRQDLWEAVCSGLVFQQDDAFIFCHDRLQEAAYSLIPERERAAVHLRIGRRLLSHAGPDELPGDIFDVVNHLNQGAELIESPAERERLADLNAAAGGKARASTAYTTARNFFSAAVALLPEETWDSRHDFKFALFLNWAECEYLRGAFEEAEELFDVLLAHAKSDFDKAAVYELRLKVYQVAGKYDDAVEMGLKALELFGVEIPTDDEALNRETKAERATVKVNLRGRRIEELADAPEATDPRARAVIGLLSGVTGPAYIGSRPQLYPLLAMKCVNYSLRFGPTKESCHGYTDYGLLLASLFDDPHSGYAFSEMSIKLNQRLGDVGLRGAILHIHADHINFWLNPIGTDIAILEKSFLACLDVGDLVFAGFTAFCIACHAVERGDPLADVLNFSCKYADFARGCRNEAIYCSIRLEQQFLKCLMGKTLGPSSFSDEALDERSCVEMVATAAFTCGVAYYHSMKLMAAYLMGDDAAAQVHAEEAKKVLRAVMSAPMETTFCFFHTLTVARACREATGADRDEFLKTLTVYEDKLSFWAKNCPANFSAKHALVCAEIAEIRGDEQTAEQLFEKAIESAKANGFIHWEGMANESAARFHGKRGLKTIAGAYLREARYCYARWGADAKVKQLDALHPWLLEKRAAAEPETIATRSEQLDVTAIAKAQRAISGEMVREQLAETLLRIVLENAGAQKGYLLVEPGSELFAAAGPGGQVEFYRAPPESFPSVAKSILNYVKRTRQSVILADASSDAGDFSTDEHLLRTKPKSVLCLPILRQAKLIGVLYLENNLAPGAFTPDRRTVLEMLASQAAISLENAGVYDALRKSEAKYRLIVDTAAEGIWMLGPDAMTIFVNASMAKMLGHKGEEMIGRPVTDFMYEEEAPDHLRRMEARRQALPENYERRFRRKDGQAVWTLISATPIFDDEHRFSGSLAMITNITTRKRAEQDVFLMSFALNNVREAAFLIDENARLRFVNEESCRVLGYDRDELLRLGVADVDPDFPVERWPSHWRDLKQQGSLIFEGRHKTKDGRIIPVEISANYFEYDKVGYNLALARDISERKQAQAEILQLNRELEQRVAQRTVALEASNKELEAFNYSVSHDLRTPLRAIDGYSRMLLEDYRDALDAEGQRYLGCVRQGAGRMGRLIDDLLAFSRMSRGEIVMEMVDMSALAQAVFAELSAQTAERSIRFVLGELPPARCDPAMMRQVLSNLLGNAMKYTGPRPEAVIEVFGTAGEAETIYCVRDNGVGFDMQYVDKLFGVFQRLHSAEEFEGTGIGLAIVKRIVERHGGRVWAEGAVDGGAAVYFALPGVEEARS